MEGSKIKPQGGFTFVELTVVAAIAALMLLALLTVNIGQKNNSRFTVGMDQILGTVNDVKGQSRATITPRSDAQAGKSPYTIFAKAIEYAPNSPQYIVATLLKGTGSELVECDEPGVNLPDNITNKDGAATAIIFQHIPNQVFYASGYTTAVDAGGVCESPGVDALISSNNDFPGLVKHLISRATSGGAKILSPPALAAGGADLLYSHNYDSLAGPFGASGTINFADPADATQTGTLTIDPSANSITRSYAH